MIGFLARRLVYALLTLWVLSGITFMLGKLAPGGPAEVELGQHAAPALIAQYNHQHGLDRPMWVQYGDWLGRFVRGDFGTSYRWHQPIAPMLAQRYPVTLQLGVQAALLALLIGVPLGLAAALRPGAWPDRLATTIALSGVSLPAFVVLPLLVLLFSLRLGWFPAAYNGEWWQLLLPAVALGVRPAALVARMTRASLLEALTQDYVRTARAKGLGPLVTLFRHAGRNAVVPVLTVFGTSVGYLLGGSFVVEAIFGVPGVGAMSVDSIPARDYPTIQAVTLLGAAVFILVNLLVDLFYGIFDPRLRAAGASQ